MEKREPLFRRMGIPPQQLFFFGLVLIGLAIVLGTFRLMQPGRAFSAYNDAPPQASMSGGTYQLQGGLRSRSVRFAPPLRLGWSRITTGRMPIVAQTGVLTRSVSVSPAAFIRDVDSTNVVMDNDLALRWAANVSDEAGFYLARPADWDGTSPVTVRVFFALGGNGAGAVNWRLKLNTYTPNSGEWLTNPGTRDADSLLTFPSGPSWYRIYSQSFTLSDSNLADAPLWSFFLLRGNATNSETFAGQLYLLNVEVSYLRNPPSYVVYLPIARR
ncbi:hypothetical protein [Candidatus Chloroploca asiatica]|uniref:Uncharacterized protein n=1 Tax=Candidatus Chloroploca asiatica TaxID=1506545 RepID=A0A2H3KMG4_9CHLR|nr:hypothetical protein [Candidatus Chloroploca asiatica]PDV99322.1 hypothetical protein A9Q02_12525 [Candidatus Chloroploca asiatica]